MRLIIYIEIIYLFVYIHKNIIYIHMYIINHPKHREITPFS